MATVALKSSAGKWIMVSTILASAMAFIDGTALNVVLPALQKNLNATGTDLFWMLNAYLLMLASLILIIGSAIAGVGLLLLSLVKQTAGAKDFWTTFFSVFLV